jgi:hypothetical protein
LQPAVALRAVATGRLPAQRSPVGEAGTAAHQPSAEIPSRQRHAAVVGNVASHAVTGAMDPVCGTRG